MTLDLNYLRIISTLCHAETKKFLIFSPNLLISTGAIIDPYF